MTSPSSQLQVQHININELKASEFNPRTWSDHQLAKLRESIEKFGVVDPLIVNTHPSRSRKTSYENMGSNGRQLLRSSNTRDTCCETVAKRKKTAFANGITNKVAVKNGLLRLA